MSDDQGYQKLATAIEDDERRRSEDRRIRAGFQAMEASVIAELNDETLVALQFEYPPTSPQFLRAEREWQRRLFDRQISSQRLAIWVGLAGVLLGAILAWVFTQFAQK